MGEKIINVAAVDGKSFRIPILEGTTVEEVVIIICQRYEIKPVLRHLFAFRFDNQHWCALNSHLWHFSYTNFEFRIRYRVPNLSILLEKDVKAFDYYFFQVRDDILKSRIGDISYEKHKDELMGLGVTDMYRAMLQTGKTKENMVNDYKKFIPKEVLKHHKFFVKKPINDSLQKIERLGIHRELNVKQSYLEQFEEMAPNYMSEEFDAQIAEATALKTVLICVNPFHREFPGIQYIYRGKKEWHHLCSFEDLCCISLHKDEGTAEISRRTGIPLYITFASNNSMVSFVTLVDGYYRLSVKWTFNLCRDFLTPSLHTLHLLKCHGPVGGKFSYAKLVQKRDNKPGCFILRECEISYNVYYLDACNEVRKIITYKVEHRGEGHFWFSADSRTYESLQELILKHRSVNSSVPLLECIPPSEYDETNLLLCRIQFKNSRAKDMVKNYEYYNSDGTSGPSQVIHINRLQKYSGKLYDGRYGCTQVHKFVWRISEHAKMDVALKFLKPAYREKYLKEFLNVAGKWADVRSGAIVRLLGVTLSPFAAIVTEFFPIGPLDSYLQRNKKTLQEVDLVEAATNIANAVWHLEGEGIVHGYIRAHKILVASHTESKFSVRLADPGIHISYTEHDHHWIPPEHYSNLENVANFSSADVWALGTTMWQLFSYGQQPSVDFDVKNFYLTGRRLGKPRHCGNEVYNLMVECWHQDPDQRKKPQAAMRDINQLLYQVFNSRRIHPYAAARPVHVNQEKVNLQISGIDNSSASYSGSSQLTASSYVDENTHHDPDDIEDSCKDLGNSSLSTSPEMSSLLNFHYTEDTSLESISVQSIFECTDNLNVVLQGLIGQGFYGEVYKGYLEDKNSTAEAQVVAVKKLKTNRPSCMKDFEREIEIMKKLKHPNIVEMKTVIQEPEVLLIMEYVEYGSLKCYLCSYKDWLTPNNHLLKYAADIANGMAYLGEKNIVHRDLAARNVLVANEFLVKISDFGLAQVTEASYYIIKTHRELPIRWYAPESLRDGKFSARSDVWSYGVLLFEMFSYGDDPIISSTSGDSTQLLELLESGIRLPRPAQCPDYVYSELMTKCWSTTDKERLTFAQIIEVIKTLSPSLID
ncbi:tyrosine-protein kinase hopscotch [Rhodnius prolixus]